MNEDEAGTNIQGPQTLKEFIIYELEFAKNRAIGDAYNIHTNIKSVEIGDEQARKDQPGLRRLMIDSAVYQKKLEDAQDALSRRDRIPAINILNAKINELNQLIQANSATGARDYADAYLAQLNALRKLKEKI